MCGLMSLDPEISVGEHACWFAAFCSSPTPACFMWRICVPCRESSLEGVQYWLDMIHQQGASPVLTLCGTMGDKPIRRVCCVYSTGQMWNPNL